MAFTCLVCGFPHLTEPPRPESGGGSFEICPCCGYQFGVDDDDEQIPYAKARADWVQHGMPWRSTNPPPRQWDPKHQLSQIQPDASAAKGASTTRPSRPSSGV